MMLGFLIGLFIGDVIGMFVTALCCAARNGERKYDKRD